MDAATLDLQHDYEATQARRFFEVRRYMQDGGWALVIRTENETKASMVRDAMERACGMRAAVDLVAVDQ